MNPKNPYEQISGYAETVREIEVLRKYGSDHSDQRGAVKSAVDLYHPKRIHLQVSKIIEETPTTKTLRVVPESGYLPVFQAGQYINLFVQIDGVDSSRPYSIASAPNQRAYYDLTVKRVDNGFVSPYLLDGVAVGDSLSSTGPMGNFFHNPLFHSDKMVFLAGGSGITPMMSMIREATDRGLDRQMHLFYGCRAPDDVIFGEELEHLAATHDKLTVDLVISEPPAGYEGLTGFISGELLQQRLGTLDDRTFYICGPEAMYRFCRDQLKALGLPRKQVRIEVFGPPGDVTREEGWPSGLSAEQRFTVRVANRGAFEVKAGEPLMNALERHHLVLPAACRSGECSYCRVRMLSGRVFHAEGTKLRKSDLQFNYIHPCMAYPLEDLEILL